MLRLHTLGRLVVQGEHGPLSGAAAQPKRLALLALLAAAGDRGLPRERLAAMLWPDAPEENARRSVAQAIYALRQELGSDEAIVGTRDLRLNPDLVASDLEAFDAAVKQGRLDTAAELYAGPFLDGFRLAGSAEFERWAEDERRTWAERYAGVLAQLATRAARAGDHEGAAGWWRKLAALDPLNAKHAVGLMRALAESGDVPGALQHARVYEALVAQELELPPDASVVQLVEELRRGRERPARAASPTADSRIHSATGVEVSSQRRHETAEDVGGADTGAASPAAVPRADPASDSGATSRRRLVLAATALAAGVALVAAIALLPDRQRPSPSDPDAGPIFVVGRIADHGPTPSAAGPLGDMLATNLARSPGLQVVSGARMYELLGRVAAGREPTPDDVSEIARRAGASEIVDGAVYQLPAGGYRLDLRRVDIATGRVRAAYSVNGADLFALADSATARLVDGLGGTRPAGSIADVTTRSIAAYRLYEQGLRAYTRLDFTSADHLFASALAEDPQFAMAALHHAQTTGDLEAVIQRLARALPLARRASERERLIIEARWAQANQDPNLAALADTLVRKYPLEIDGHLLLAGRVVEGDRPLDAIPSLHRVVALDSLGLSGSAPRCSACDALRLIADAYVRSDSLEAALRTAREWTRLQPRNAMAYNYVAFLLSYVDSTEAALATLQTAERLSPTYAEHSALSRASILLRASDYRRADSAIAAALGSPRPVVRHEGRWWRHYSLRARGRLREALAVAHTFRAEDTIAVYGRGAAPFGALPQAITYFESGRHRESMALFDSLARAEWPGALPTLEAERGMWNLAHSAGAAHAAGDTVRLRRLADSLALLGRTSPRDRNRRLHHYARGLLHMAGGRVAEAEGELRQAIGSPTMGYSRASLALAAVLRRRGGALEAVRVLQPTFRGDIEASGLYATTTERHEALADAWREAGRGDSAAAHYRIVAMAWREGDQPFAARAARARRLADSLTAPR